ncbi:MAG: 50S ribosomal protein L32e, partial [Methanoregula sp.]|nr:50S ribosomal protein L32e [Methanoregula sp.]
LPKPGYGSPIAVRGMHPSGFFEVLVFTEKELETLDSKTQAIRISAGVGARKRKLLQEKAVEAGFKVLNTRIIKASVTKETPAEPAKNASKDKKGAKENKETSAKKVASKPEDAKKKNADTKKSVKPAAAGKDAADKKEGKSVKAPAKEPAKKSAPAKAEKKPATSGAKAETAKPKKKSPSEVKKND